MERFALFALIGLLATGCAHASGTVSQGGLQMEVRSYDPEKMVMAAAKATTTVKNAETCEEAVLLGRPVMTEDCSTMPYRYGGGAFNGGSAFVGGMGGAMGFYYGGVAPAPAPVAQAPREQAGTANAGPDNAIRAELDEVRELALRAERKGEKTKEQMKGLIKKLSTTPDTQASQTTTNAPAVTPAPAPSSEPTPATGSGNANLPPP